MKKLLLVSSLVFCCVLNTQAQLQTTVNANNNNLNALATYGPDGANIGSTSLVINPPESYEGSVYLFDEWNNKGVFMTTKDRKLLIRNINFNVDLGVFESQITKDTVFTFSFDNVQRVFVNSREFKARFTPSTGIYDVYEVIYENDDFAILKQYYIDVREGSDNPMVNRKNKLLRKSRYFIERNDTLRAFRFKKKNILELAGDKADKIEAYAKKHRLSLKKEIDVSRMFSLLLN